GVLYRANHRAEAARDEARARLLFGYEEQGRKLLLGGDAPRALVYLSRAFEEGADSAGLRFMIGSAMRSTSAQRQVLEGHRGFVNWVGFSPDGSRIATSSMDQTACLWEAGSGKKLFCMEHPAALVTARFSPDGAVLF